MFSYKQVVVKRMVTQWGLIGARLQQRASSSLLADMVRTLIARHKHRRMMDAKHNLGRLTKALCQRQTKTRHIQKCWEKVVQQIASISFGYERELERLTDGLLTDVEALVKFVSDRPKKLKPRVLFANYGDMLKLSALEDFTATTQNFLFPGRLLVPQPVNGGRGLAHVMFGVFVNWECEDIDDGDDEMAQAKSLKNELAHANIITNLFFEMLVERVTSTTSAQFKIIVLDIVAIQEEVRQLIQSVGRALLKPGNLQSSLRIVVGDIVMHAVARGMLYSNLTNTNRISKAIKHVIANDGTRRHCYDLVNVIRDIIVRHTSLPTKLQFPERIKL